MTSEIRQQFGDVAAWSKALVIGLLAALVVLSLFDYWFAIADRYVVFLYYHDMGPLVPDTAPFSRVTSSRYIMAGLVAAGIVMVRYSVFSWLWGRFSKSAQGPAWWRIWLVAALPLLIGIPFITTRFNQPVLPFRLAIEASFVALAGLALALLPGPLALREPRRLLGLAADGFGLALLLITVPHIDNISLWLNLEGNWRPVLGLTILLAGLLWLVLLSLLRWRMKLKVEDYRTLLIAGFCVAYLLLPFLHYTLGSHGYFYLTTSDNFFSQHILTQAFAWLVTLLVAWAIMRLRIALAKR